MITQVLELLSQDVAWGWIERDVKKSLSFDPLIVQAATNCSNNENVEFKWESWNFSVYCQSQDTQTIYSTKVKMLLLKPRIFSHIYINTKKLYLVYCFILNVACYIIIEYVVYNEIIKS